MPDDVRAFYNTFTHSRMVNYHTTPNLRVEKACAFVLSHTPHDAKVFEIGCGVGVLTKQLDAHLTHGVLTSVDISDDAVAIARTYALTRSVIQMDVLADDFSSVRWVDTIALCDTLEHLPLDKHGQLMVRLSDVCTMSAQILITLPSPEYQSYLTAHNPGELQIIDHTITEEMLHQCAGWFGGRLDFYRLIDVWRPRQYVHARIVR